jgi:hypothetical protein
VSTRKFDLTAPATLNRGTMVQIVILSANGESRTLKTGAITAAATGATVAKSLRKVKAADLIGTYDWKGLTLTLWGWREGKAGTENKHELPPPHDEGLLFGDAVVTGPAGIDITVDIWSQFYDAAFGGFEDLGSEDSDDDADADEDDEVDAEVDEESEDDNDSEGDDESSVDAEDSGEEEDEGEEEEEEEEEDGDCYDDGEDGGGSKRRAPRRRALAAPEYRRIDMGLRSRVKIPTPIGKRAPRWQTAPELEEEGYD